MIFCTLNLGHNLNYITRTKSTTQGKLDDLIEQLPSFFVRCHKSYLLISIKSKLHGRLYSYRRKAGHFRVTLQKDRIHRSIQKPSSEIKRTGKI
ncbi:MAG: LytTR family transcriptional regulator DNA-binding domain-containing protein [[Eubacterium] siraeum]